jgi:GLPGLI family protein
MKINPTMKRVIIFLGVLVSLTATHLVFGQAPEGVITYELKVNMHRRLPPERAEMKAMIPEFRTTRQQLFFKLAESIYKPLIEDEDEETSASGSGGVRMVMRIPNNEIYLDQHSSRIISRQEFLGKDYLIEDSVRMAPWKFGTETKIVQGYPCKQAFYTDELQPNQKQAITAWYTDKLRPFLGPERFNTLPGAVLAVDVNNGERIIVAIKIEMRGLKKNELKMPTSGAKTTPEEFRKMVDDQVKRMGGRDGMIIR